MTGLSAHEPFIFDKHQMFVDMVYKYNFSIKSLYSILSFLNIKWKYYQEAEYTRAPIKYELSNFLFSNIEIDPCVFITHEEILIPFDVIERICKDKNIIISPQCWANNYFIQIRKSFFVSTLLLKEDAYNYFNTLHFFDKIFFKIVNGYASGFTTTKYYLRLEKYLSNEFLKNALQDDKQKNIYSLELISSFINQYEFTRNIKLNEGQKNAIIKSIQNKVHIICGFPGTGKSTIFDAIKEFYYTQDTEYNISCMAPTGLALKNLIKKCKVKNPEICGTIHRMVYNIFHYTNNDFDEKRQSENVNPHMQSLYIKKQSKFKKYSNLVPDMIAIDEFSMVDSLLFRPILYWCKKFGCKLIIMGDENQLPPIGPGNILYSLTHSLQTIKHVTFLTDIMRQDNPLLIRNIKMIKNGEYLLKDANFDNKSMSMIDYASFLNLKKEICYNRLTSFIIENQLESHNTQFLTPENGKNCGTCVINIHLQNFYNPETFQNKIHGSTFRLNDLIVRTQNCLIDEDNGIFANGDIGTIVRVNYKNNDCKQIETVTIQYDNMSCTQNVSVSELHDEFSLRYCLTIHKSQGGEYDNVVLFMGTPHADSSWKQNNGNKLLYTAVSRTKCRCFIIAKDNLLSITQTIESRPPLTSFLKINVQ
jgi:ATP-dependent exoDNAse (exonuclease V) alpha subunit